VRSENFREKKLVSPAEKLEFSIAQRLEFGIAKKWSLALRSGRPRSQSALLLILGTHSKFARKIKFASARRLLPADMLERWPHGCRVKIMFTLPLTNRFVSTTTISMKCLVNWILLRICNLSRSTQAHHKYI